MQTFHHTRILDETDAGMELEIEIDLAPAEPDVGIAPYVDDWRVVAVEGNTSTQVCQWATDIILEKYGDDVFVERLYDEGVGT